MPMDGGLSNEANWDCVRERRTKRTTTTITKAATQPMMIPARAPPEIAPLDVDALTAPAVVVTTLLTNDFGSADKMLPPNTTDRSPVTTRF